MIDGKVRLTGEYRKEIFNEIKKHINSNEDINDIIIAGDYNQFVVDNEVRKFHTELGVSEIHHKVNNVELRELDKTYKNGSSPIDSIVALSSIMEYVVGCHLMNYNEIVKTDYWAYVIDVDIEEYFDEAFSGWDNINRVMLNPARRSHRNVFLELIEEQLDVYKLEMS